MIGIFPDHQRTVPMEHGPRRFYIAASQGFVGLFVAALCAVSLGLGREPIVGGATLLLVLLALAYEHVIGKRRTASGDAPAGPGSAAGRVRPRAQVWIQRGQSKGRYLVGQTLLVGRGAECGLQLIYDEGVSRQHCHFASTENGFVLLDLDSSNGTYVNGDKVIDQVVVEDGDVIRCGAAELIFRTKVDPLHELKPGSVIVERERPMISEWAGLSPNQHLVAEANGQPEGGSLPVRRLDRSLPLNSLVGSIPDEVELAAGPPEAVSFEDREETELLNSLVTLGREEHPGGGREEHLVRWVKGERSRLWARMRSTSGRPSIV